MAGARAAAPACAGPAPPLVAFDVLAEDGGGAADAAHSCSMPTPRRYRYRPSAGASVAGPAISSPAIVSPLRMAAAAATAAAEAPDALASCASTSETTGAWRPVRRLGGGGCSMAVEASAPHPATDLGMGVGAGVSLRHAAGWIHAVALRSF